MIPVAQIKKAQLELGALLREFRCQRSLTASELALRSNMSVSKISKIELGRVTTSVLTLRRLATAMNLPYADSERLLMYGRTVDRLNSPDHPAVESIDDLVKALLSANDAAFLQPFVIPAPLQTRRYAERSYRNWASKGVFGAMTMEEFLYFRMRAKSRLYDPNARFRYVLSHGGLTSLDDMTENDVIEQFDHLLEIACLSSVECRYLPVGAWSFSMSFGILDNKMVYVDDLPSDHLHVVPSAVEIYKSHFETVWQQCLGAEESLEVFHRYRDASMRIDLVDPYRAGLAAT